LSRSEPSFGVGDGADRLRLRLEDAKIALADDVDDAGLDCFRAGERVDIDHDATAAPPERMKSRDRGRLSCRFRDGLTAAMPVDAEAVEMMDDAFASPTC